MLKQHAEHWLNQNASSIKIGVTVAAGLLLGALLALRFV